VPLSPLAAGYDHVLLDLDGCVWVGDALTPRAAEAIAALRAAGTGIAFVTNDSRSPGEEFVRKLWRLGVRASLEEVVTVGGAVQFALAERYGRDGAGAIVVGAPAVHRHVRDAGLRVVNGTPFAVRADVVVVAAHERFDYAELREAVQAVLRGARLLAAGRDATFPMPDGPWPATGAVLAAVETATGARAENVGKPEAGLVRTALDRLGPGRALLVGDRADADLGAAHAAGIDGALVLTGASGRAEADAAGSAAVAVADTLADLVLAPGA
jgi:HAD superfamily hydrolase (TIGR01450 family)